MRQTNTNLFLFLGVMLAIAVATPVSPAVAQLFGPGDPIIAVHRGPISSYPGAGEAPDKVADQLSSTKYLNFGAAGTGFIITPAFGSSVVNALQLTTANDAPERDPVTYDLFGTNDAITSGDNSLGDQENWIPISSGMTGFDVDPGRETLGPVVPFSNGSAYTSYKMIFPTIADAGAANSMQVADVALFSGVTEGGTQILAAGDPALAVTDNFGSASNYPDPNEAPDKAIDGDPATKYLNFAGKNSGFIVNRADGLSTIIDSFTMTTGGDAPSRDPAAWELFGTDDMVVSEDNSTGEGENWTLIDSGMVMLPKDRGAVGPLVSVDNSTAYGAYRMMMTELRGGPGEGIMQVAEVTFGGTVVPEPASLLGMLLGTAVLGGFLRRR